MRITTTLDIVRRSLVGHPPRRIAADMHLGYDTVIDILRRSGWPSRDLMRAWRREYIAGANRKPYAVAEEAAQYAATMRVSPDWVHAATEDKTHEQLRGLVAVMAAMLPAGVVPQDALAWLYTGKKVGRPKKVRVEEGEVAA